MSTPTETALRALLDATTDSPTDRAAMLLALAREAVAALPQAHPPQLAVQRDGETVTALAFGDVHIRFTDSGAEVRFGDEVWTLRTAKKARIFAVPGPVIVLRTTAGGELGVAGG